MNSFLMFRDVWLSDDLLSHHTIQCHGGNTGALVGLDVRDFDVHGFWKGLFWISSSVAMACECFLSTGLLCWSFYSDFWLNCSVTCKQIMHSSVITMMVYGIKMFGYLTSWFLFVVASIHCILTTTFANIYGPNLALRGPSGCVWICVAYVNMCGVCEYV